MHAATRARCHRPLRACGQDCNASLHDSIEREALRSAIAQRTNIEIRNRARADADACADAMAAGCGRQARHAHASVPAVNCVRGVRCLDVEEALEGLLPRARVHFVRLCAHAASLSAPVGDHALTRPALRMGLRVIAPGTRPSRPGWRPIRYRSTAATTCRAAAKTTVTLWGA